jgi:hypothetical protein
MLGCLLIALAIIPAAAQQNVTGQDIGDLPLSFVIDNVISTHEQDIKDRMLDYEFDSAGSEAAKAGIVKKRSAELTAAAMKRQAFLEALDKESNLGLIPEGRLKAMINATISNIQRMTGSSKKLQEKAKKLNKRADADSVDQAVSGLNSVSLLADHVSKAHTNVQTKHA